MSLMIVDNESARLNALRDLKLLDTPPSESFDRLTRMASRLFNAPVSTISLTDSDRQWFKSRVGVDLVEIPREQAPCNYAIRSDEVFVVPDLLEDERFKDSPLAQAGIRFYAGAPLLTRAGYGLGTLCVVDTKPRSIADEDQRVLRDLASMVMAQVEIQNMIGRVDATSGQANEHQLFEDLTSLGQSSPTRVCFGMLVEFVSTEQASQGLRVLGASYSEQVTRGCLDKLRGSLSNGMRLYQVGPVRCLALWDEADGPDFETVIHSWRAILAEPVLCSGIPVNLDLAMGVYRFTAGESSPQHTLRCLYNAIDDARRSSSAQASYSKQQDEAHARNFAILNDVPAAIAGGEFNLVYQPRIDVRTGRCIGAEALLRWTHPKLGPLSPAEFIPLVEQTAFVQSMTDWVLDEAIRQSAAWSKAGITPPRLSINASPHNLEEPDFVERLRDRLRVHGVAPSVIELEFTETALAANEPFMVAQLEAVRALGIEVAIDDFGTGYSSLSYLRRLPASILKIDRSFMDSLTGETRDGKLVKTMIDMGHDLGFRVVAEGVETAAVLALLREWHCDEAQGYFIAKPLPEETFRQWLGVQGVPLTTAA